MRILAYVTNGSEDHLVADVPKDVGFRAVNTPLTEVAGGGETWDGTGHQGAGRGRKQF